jgi:hypothetical protein
MPIRSLAALVALAALAASAAPARAGDEQGAIAVLPFTSSEAKLEMYGVPVSRALVVELRGAAGAPVQIVADPASLPRRIAWVIDGRILQRGRGKVVLEARLRDPDQGRAAGLVATGARPLRQIDRLARELARELLPVLEGARSARQRDSDRRAAIGLAKNPPPQPVDPPRPAGGPRVLLVGRSGGGDSTSGIAADPVATASAVDFAQRLGRRPLVMELSGIAPPDAVRAALGGAGASHALLTQVVGVDFRWLGVLTARGRVRVVLVDTAGSPLYDEIIETDTLVGSRGDRQEALFGFVAGQALDIARPRLRRLLAR